MDLCMKVLFFALLVFLSACDKKPRDTKSLPWKTSITESGATRVLGIDIGDVNLTDLSIRLRDVPDIALFESDKGKLNLEAYFGKVNVGLLEARIVADLEASDAFLKQVKSQARKREATPNNNWKYKLTEDANTKAFKLKVWRLVYMPTGQYEEKQIKFFGEPEETIKVTDTAEYRLFPSKGYIILWDTDGGEIFYYVAKKDFARLKASLPMKLMAAPKKSAEKD